MKGKDIDSIINLLDDPDEEVYSLISADIMSQGNRVVPVLEKAWYQTTNVIVQHRIENILFEIQYEEAMRGFADWIANGAIDVLEGAYWIAKFQYPNIKFSDLTNEIEAIKTNIWLNTNDTPNPIESISFINQTLYKDYGYSIKKQGDALSPVLCYINHLLDSKIGNAISFGVLYLAIAQRLGLPIFGVCLPGSFMLCYKRENDRTPYFYIDLNGNGQLVRKDDVVDYINRLGIDYKESQIEACDNQRVALRIAESLVFTYEQAKNSKKVELYRSLLTIFGKGYDLEV